MLLHLSHLILVCSVRKSIVHHDVPLMSLLRPGENRCLKCCRKGHKANSCKTKVNYYNCKGSHHTLLCQKSKQKSDQSDSSSKTKEDTTPNPSPLPKSCTTKQSAKPVTTSSITTQTSACGGGIALPTAMLRLKTRATSNEVNTLRCFFDSGSQKSFILPEVLKTQLVQCATIKSRLSLGTKMFSISFIVSNKVEMKLHTPGLGDTVKMLKNSGLRLVDHRARDQLNL